MANVTKGSCNCGRVRWKVEGEMRQVIACHCTQCRKHSGHYFAASSATDSDLTIEGSENLTWYQSSQEAKRGFCSTCGAALFWKRFGADTTSILAGSIDGETGLKLVEHIFVADKADYYEITDKVPQRQQ